MRVKITKHYLTLCPFCDSEIIYSEADIRGRPHHSSFGRGKLYYFDTKEELLKDDVKEVVGLCCPVCGHAIKHEEKSLMSVRDEELFGIKDEYIDM